VEEILIAYLAELRDDLEKPAISGRSLDLTNEVHCSSDLCGSGTAIMIRHLILRRRIVQAEVGCSTRYSYRNPL
jgi:hypothetical protein